MVESPAILLYEVHECWDCYRVFARILSPLFQGCDVHCGGGKMR